MGRRRVDLQTAAELLGISSDAVRKRAKRGTMPYETGADGKLYVWVDTGQTRADGGADKAGAGPVSADPSEAPPPGPDHRDELVEELRDRVRALEEANHENRRLLAAALERIPAIEPPETRDARETVSDGEYDTGTPAGDTGEPRGRSSWWRRFFGFE